MSSPDVLLEYIFSSLLSPDNDVRQQGEVAFQNAKHQPELLVKSMMKCIRYNENTSIRAISCVLLRRLLTGDEISLWNSISFSTREEVKRELLEAVRIESQTDIRTKMVHVIGELGVAILEDNQWNELLPFCRDALVMGTNEQKISALGILKDISYYLATIVKDDVRLNASSFDIIISRMKSLNTCATC